MTRFKRLLHVPETGVIVPFVVLALIFFWIDHTFLNLNCIGAMFRAIAFVGLVAIGQTWLIIAGRSTSRWAQWRASARSSRPGS